MFSDLTDDIISYLNSRGISYREKEKYFTIKCINPSHDDKHPSMSVDKDSGLAYCISCGYKERLIKGKRIEYDKSKYSVQQKERKEVILELPKAYTLFEYGVPSLKITPELARDFNIGFCANGYGSKPDEEICKKCCYYDNYSSEYQSCSLAKSRVMTPIMGENKVLSIECRDISKKSSKKVLYPKHSAAHLTIFNYENLNFEEPLYVTEGIKSLMVLYKEISKNSTAIFSNRIKMTQFPLLGKFKKIILIPDHGLAGELTVQDFRSLKNTKLEVIRIPRFVQCKDCGSKIRGLDKMPCSKCGSENTDFSDIFDLGVDMLKDLCYNISSKSDLFGSSDSLLEDLVINR